MNRERDSERNIKRGGLNKKREAKKKVDFS